MDEPANLEVGKDNPLVKTKKQLIQRIKSRIGIYQTYDKWVIDEDIFRKNASAVFHRLSKFLNMIDQEYNYELKYNTWEVIARKFAQVYLAIYLKKSDEFEALLLEVKTLVHYCSEGDGKFISVIYLPGLRYCMKGLEISSFKKNQFLKYNLEELQVMDKSIVRFTQITKLGKVAVVAMRSIFTRLFDRNSYDFQESMLETMIRKDSKNGQWVFWHHNVRRYHRRQKLNFNPPDSEEIALIAKAAVLSPKNPRILIGLYSAMAEIVRVRGPNWKGSEDLGFGRIFHSSVEIVQFLKVEIRKILVLDPTSAKINVSAAEIFSSTLPVQFWDIVFAKLNIERALIFHQKCSKANGCMGYFLLTSCRDPQNAIIYLKQSYDLDKRNFQALFELLMSYFSIYEVAHFNIESILKSELVNPKWTRSNLGYLYFVKGIYCYLNWEFRTALECWITYFEKCGDMNLFENFTYFKEKFGWQIDDLNLGRIYYMAKMASSWTVKFSKKRRISEAVLKVLLKERNKERDLARMSNFSRESGSCWWANYCYRLYSKKIRFTYMFQ